MTSPPRPAAPEAALAADVRVEPAASELERRGRLWMLVSFVACPCHLPLTLGALGVLLGGTALGAVLRDHGLVAGLVISSAWLLGTGRGLWLVRRAERSGYSCPVPSGSKVDQ